MSDNDRDLSYAWPAIQEAISGMLGPELVQRIRQKLIGHAGGHEAAKRRQEAKGKEQDEEGGGEAMPFQKNDELPDEVKALPEGAQTLWRATFNGVFEQHGDEEAAIKMAWAAVKMKYRKGKDGEWREASDGGGEELEAQPITEQAEAAEGEGAHILYVDLAVPDATGKPMQVLRAGDFTDMHGRQVKVAPEELAEFVANTKALIAQKVDTAGQPIGLPIDEKLHEKGDAAGWIKDVELRDGVVYALPAWTELGVQKIRANIMRWFSPTIDLVRKVIRGGSLTNWPAIPGLAAVELATGVYRMKPQDKAADKGGEKRMSQAAIDTVVADFRQKLEGGLALPPAAEPKAAETQGQAPAVNVADLFNLEQAKADLKKAAEEAILAEYNQMREELSRKVAGMMAEAMLNRDTANFCEEVTGKGQALPIKAAELQSHLVKIHETLGREEYNWWKTQLERVHTAGLVDMSEIGSSGDGRARMQLPDTYVQALDAGRIKLTDLSDPVLGLGDMAQYDLSKWQK